MCLDADLRPLRPAIVWLDNRATAEAEELASVFGAEEIYSHSGQVECVATWTASKLLWLKRHEPGTFASTSKFALLEDWLIYRLTGVLVGEHSLYPTTLLMDIHTLGWWPEMLASLELDPSRLPELVPSGTVVGGLTEAAASELGLAVGTPVITGGLDQVVATMAGGNLQPGTVTELTGTLLALAASVTEMPERARMLPVYLHVIPDLYCVLPYGQTGGVMLRWVRDNCYGLPGAGAAHPSYEEVIEEASHVEPGAGGVVCLPHLAGAYYPEFDMACRGVIAGLRMGHSRAQIVRAVLEAIGYMLKRCVDGMRAAGIAVNELTCLGPASTSRTWRQIKADICELPVYRITCDEASLLGVGMIAAVATGQYSGLAEAAGAMATRIDPVVPNVDFHAVYQQRMVEYALLYSRLRSHFNSSVYAELSQGAGAVGGTA
jgi:xylulokinase